MKRFFLCSVVSLLLLCTGCLGSFSAFNELRSWNEDFSDDEFVNNAIFWGLNIIPVYPLVFMGDVIVFNVVEYWTGSNPIVMQEGEFESQIIEKDGVKYEMLATRNQIKIRVLSGEREGSELLMFYEPKDRSWNTVKDGEKIKLSSYEEGFYIVYLPDGEEIKVDQNATKEEAIELVQERIASYRSCLLATAE